MKLHKFEDASLFYDVVKDYLFSQTDRHSFLLRLTRHLITNPERYEQFYLAVVEKEENIIAVAIRTPPRRLLLSKIVDFAAVELLVQDLQHQQLPGVSGFLSEVQAFVEAWQNITGQLYTPGLQLKIHKLKQVQPIPTAQGYLRLAEDSDRQLLIPWVEAFAVEAGLEQENTEAVVDNYLTQKYLYLWVDNLPVSMAGGRLWMENKGWIGPVYTPPQYRKKGYASSCVAALSQSLLDEGCQDCYLFTDSSNPTSNRIYQAIGYQFIDNWYDYNINTFTSDATR
jgi:hypothetical protein